MEALGYLRFLNAATAAATKFCFFGIDLLVSVIDDDRCLF